MTYGKIGEWRFDKRSYDNKWPPRNLSLPPPGVPESVVWLSVFVIPITGMVLGFCFTKIIDLIIKIRSCMLLRTFSAALSTSIANLLLYG